MYKSADLILTARNYELYGVILYI